MTCSGRSKPFGGRVSRYWAVCFRDLFLCAIWCYLVLVAAFVANLARFPCAACELRGCLIRNHAVEKRERDRLDRLQSAFRRLALRSQTHFSVIHGKGMKAFGETPKAADEDVRAPQSICMGTAYASSTALGAFGMVFLRLGRRA